MTDVHDIAIVGAGAAGLAAAIAAGQAAHDLGKSLRIVLLDAANQIGRKILIAGGGRCNVTNERVTPDDYAGSRNIIRNALAAFDQSATVHWLQDDLGIPLKREETGKYFPATDSARTILDALIHRCANRGVVILPEHRVRQIDPPTTAASAPDAFAIRCDGSDLLASRVILATGGRSWPQIGATAEGLELARALGHTVTDLHPALVPLVLDDSFFHASLAGLTHDVELRVFVDGKRVDQRTGSMLWTHFGISGPVVLDTSRHWIAAHAAGHRAELHGSFLPGDDFAVADRWLTDLTATVPQRLLDTLLAKRLPRRLAEALLRYSRIDPNIRAGQLRREQRRDLVHVLTGLPLPVTGHRGWQAAEVMAGGVPLQEMDYRTMQSRKTPGLFLAGEMLDCDGRLGGFNLQWAWTTGYIAGRSAVWSLLRTE